MIQVLKQCVVESMFICRYDTQMGLFSYNMLLVSGFPQYFGAWLQFLMSYH